MHFLVPLFRFYMHLFEYIKLCQCMSTVNCYLCSCVRTTCIFHILYTALLALVYVEPDQWLQSSLQQQRNLILDLVPAYHYTENIKAIRYKRSCMTSNSKVIKQQNRHILLVSLLFWFTIEHHNMIHVANPTNG